MRWRGALLLAAAFCVVGVSRRIAHEPAVREPATIPSIGTPLAKRADARSIARLGEVMRARPLFSRDRRPSAPVDAENIIGPPMPRLAGIIVTQGARVALFADATGTRVAAEGSPVGSYVVTSIASGGVELAGAAGSIVLRPGFDAPPTARRPTAREIDGDTESNK